LTAETEDSYYLTYSLYHLKDYDHPIREMMTHWSYHDNDNEGFHIRVDKASLKVVEVETWFHNRFLLFNQTGMSTGSEPVHGKIHVEGNTHVIVYVQPQGHGVRCAQWIDNESIVPNTKTMRYQGNRVATPMRADRMVQHNVTYTLGNFDAWYQKALGPFGHDGKGTSMFEETIELGINPDGTAIRIGRFIAGRDYAKGSWSRPKPMWSWDDGWDGIPIFIWHFYPSLSFESHSGANLSHHYLYNRPIEKVFSKSPEQLFKCLSLEIEHRNELKWAPLQDQGKPIGRNDYWLAARHRAIQYVNYLFHALG